MICRPHPDPPPPGGKGKTALPDKISVKHDTDLAFSNIIDYLTDNQEGIFAISRPRATKTLDIFGGWMVFNFRAK
jgi:hypothetical protein